MRWIVSELFHPDEVSTASIMTDIAEKLAESGPVGIICGPSGYESSYKQQTKILLPNIELHRVSIPDLNKNGVITRVLRLLIITIKMSFKVISKIKRDDDVLMVTNPAFLLVTMGIIKKLKNFKLAILVHDVFPENLIPAGLARSNDLKYKMLMMVFNNAYRKADHLVVLGEDMSELLQLKLGIDSERIRVIPNWYDPSISHIPGFSTSKYFEREMSDKIVISFAGNIGRVQGILEFIDTFISAKNDNLELVIIGDGALRPEIQAYMTRSNIKNIHLVGPRPRSEQIYFLNACDISLITLKEGMKGLGVPSKTYNVMAAKKPILYVGDSGSEVDRYLKIFDNGWSFSWSNKEGLADFLRKINLNDLPSIQKKGENSLLAVKQNFTREKVLESFKNYGENTDHRA